jgi:phosphoribosylpyrophosphate synthetase
MTKNYVVIAGPGCEGRAERLTALAPKRFTYFPTAWDKFGDDTDFIELGGYTPTNRYCFRFPLFFLILIEIYLLLSITGNHVLFLASFHNNDVALSQLHAMVVLLESVVESFTVCLPFYPYGTMERVIKEGQIATANSAAKIFSNLPSAGKPTRIMMYDLHTLQNRFYFGNNALASLHSCIPLMEKEIADGEAKHIDCIAFPDDGAAKRYEQEFPQLPKVTCRKIRDGDKRIIGIADGDPKGRHILIVDDLVQTGGTLYECGKSVICTALCVH